MTPQTADAAIGAFVEEIAARLLRAAAVAKAAEACITAGQREQALGILLDAEQPIYEATTLLNAASLLNRCAKG